MKINSSPKNEHEFTSVSLSCNYYVVVIVVGNGHGDTSSNPGRD